MKPYYQDERSGIVIYHGDCREVLPGLAFDVLVTDPPYGVNLGRHVGAAESRAGLLVKGAYASYQDTPGNLLDVVVPAVTVALEKCIRGLVFVAPTKARYFPEPRAVGGVYVPAACGRSAWGWQNLVVCLMYGTAPHLEDGAKATAILSTESAEDNGHPCPKPIGWMKWAVALASDPTETIIDPFMGSGTTLRAAKDLGRRAVGIEVCEKYCEIAARRLSQEVLFGPGQTQEARQ